MATGYYILGGVTVAPGDSVLTAATYQVPGAATDPVNFANLVGAAGAEGTPAGFALLGPAGQVGLVSHALSATTLQLSKPWLGAAIENGSAELVLGINALPIGRLATLITQIVSQRPLLTTNRLSEYLGDATAQAAVRANLALGDMATQSQAAYVPKTGGTFTGGVAVQGALVAEHATAAGRVNIRSTLGRSWALDALINADATDPGCLAISDLAVGRRMLLDPSGRVRIPNQPAMIATRNNNFYETFAANSQNGLLGVFSLNRGGFTSGGQVSGASVVHVPATGVYLVTLRAYVQGGSSGRLYVSRNGANTNLFIQPDAAAVDRSIDATGLLNLTAGDYLAYGVGGTATTLYTASGHTEIRAAFLG